MFAFVAPGNIVSNILAGGIAEAGAQQAGDLMQDLKVVLFTLPLIGLLPTGYPLVVSQIFPFWLYFAQLSCVCRQTGHLVGASPRAQFYGQLIGSSCSVVFSLAAYKLYTAAYEVPSAFFPVPTGASCAVCEYVCVCVVL